MFKRRLNILSIACLAICASPFAMSEDSPSAVDVGIPTTPITAADVLNAPVTDNTIAATADPYAGTPAVAAGAVLTERSQSLLARVEAALANGYDDVEQFFEDGLSSIENFISDKKANAAADAEDTTAGAEAISENPPT